jgi:hypothetical protein
LFYFIFNYVPLIIFFRRSAPPSSTPTMIANRNRLLLALPDINSTGTSSLSTSHRRLIAIVVALPQQTQFYRLHPTSSTRRHITVHSSQLFLPRTEDNRFCLTVHIPANHVFDTPIFKFFPRLVSDPFTCSAYIAVHLH